MRLVLDASMALAWLLERVDVDEQALAQRALGEVAAGGALVPDLWFAEVANGLLVAERRGVVSSRQIAVYEADLRHLDLTVDTRETGTFFQSILVPARAWNLTAYDAAYLELALRFSRPLATFDRRLAQAVRSAGGQVFGDPA